MENASIKRSDYKTELEKNRVIAFVPGGNSMWPTLKHRGQSVIVKLKEQKLKRFDVALYQRANGVFVLHRVMQPTDFGYIMCGDSQLTFERVNEEQVFGIMTAFYRKDKLIEVTDQKYIQEIEKWFVRKRYRKFRLKIFHFNCRVKGGIKHRLKKLFKKDDK